MLTSMMSPPSGTVRLLVKCLEAIEEVRTKEVPKPELGDRRILKDDFCPYDICL